MAKKKKPSVTIVQETTDHEESVTGREKAFVDMHFQAAQFKEDINAFSVPVEDDKDFISGLPSETLSHILAYCLMDHEPERAVRMQAESPKFTELPHVLLSLAAMSRRFRDQVEEFSRIHLTKHKEKYRFKTEVEMAEGKRRSQRVTVNPAKGSRCYRFQLVQHLLLHCIGCGSRTSRRAVMANGVAFCAECEGDILAGNEITLTEALKEYDLRDWMLIPTRKPGPRAKKIDLPAIPYGTILTNTPVMYSKRCVSYRFFQRNVRYIAGLVHGDIKEHMRVKKKERTRKIHRRLKIRKHTDALAIDTDGNRKKYHQKRLDVFQDPDFEDNYDSDDSTKSGYGYYNDIHEKFCNGVNCSRCVCKKQRKYGPYGDDYDDMYWSENGSW